MLTIMLFVHEKKYYTNRIFFCINHFIGSIACYSHVIKLINWTRFERIDMCFDVMFFFALFLFYYCSFLNTAILHPIDCSCEASHIVRNLFVSSDADGRVLYGMYKCVFSVQPYNKCVSCSVVLWPMNKGFTFTSQPEMEVSVCVFVYSNKWKQGRNSNLLQNIIGSK